MQTTGTVAAVTNCRVPACCLDPGLPGLESLFETDDEGLVRCSITVEDGLVADIRPETGTTDHGKGPILRGEPHIHICAPPYDCFRGRAALLGQRCRAGGLLWICRRVVSRSPALCSRLQRRVAS